MGVPKFAAWLTRKYPSMVTRDCPPDVHGLYIDLNGLIHPCCHDEDDPTVAARPEAEKLRQICLAVETLVVTTQLRHVVYIAADGVAPRAKMNQQRARRYMSSAVPQDDEELVINSDVAAAHEAEVERDLAEVSAALTTDPLYGGTTKVAGTPRNSSPILLGGDALLADVTAASHRSVKAHVTPSSPPNTDCFDSNCISPGTEFMAKVAETMRQWVEQRLASGDPLWGSLTILVSDAGTPGEGEHKLLDFLRTQASTSDFKGHGAHVVVGLDADLIFLTLSLHIPQVYILRDQKRPSRFDFKRKRMKPKRVTQLKASEDVETAASGDSDADPMMASQPLVTAPPTPTASVEACRSYEYFDMDVVGASIVSEIYALCLAKNFSMKVDPRFYGELVSSSGYNFDRVAGKADGELKNLYNGKRVKDRATSAPQPERSNETAKGGAAFGTDAWHPCRAASNSKIIDDVIVMAMLMGNDFLPRIPSAFCGESGMDNMIEIYVSAVLPYGYLTLGAQEINRVQLRRLFEAYAYVETVKFRQHCIQKGDLTVRAAAVAEVKAPIDTIWRNPYYSTTSITANEIESACGAYVGGLQFVWRYYSGTGIGTDWDWYYPYHHSPFASDLADYLQESALTPSVTFKSTATGPAEVQSPPEPFTQLLCILPPASKDLLPPCFHAAMASPPPTGDLQDTFPSSWTVDFTASYHKEHLAHVMLPFANMPALKALVKEHADSLTPAERRRNTNCDFHLVLRRSPGDAPQTADDGVTASRPYTFEIAGDGIVPLSSEAVPWPLPREETGLMYWALRDTAPLISRPRTYSFNVATPNLTQLPDGCVMRPRRGRGDGKRRQGTPSESPPKDSIVKRNHNAFVLVVFLFCAAIIACVAALFLTPIRNFLVKMQIVAIFTGAACFTYMIGIASEGFKKGSGIQRNNIRKSFVDWLCSSCLTLNFSKNNRCFVCSAPFHAARSWALFSSCVPADPPLMETDHSLYMRKFGTE